MTFMRSSVCKMGKGGRNPIVIDLDKVEPLTSELINKLILSSPLHGFPCSLRSFRSKKALLELQNTPQDFCVPLSTRRCYGFSKGKVIYVEGLKVKTVDTTARRCLSRGFIYGLLQNWELGEILRFANAASASNAKTSAEEKESRP